MFKNHSKLHKKYKLIIIFAIVFVSSFYLLFLKKGDCHNLDCISFLDKDTYKIKEVFVDQSNSFLAEYYNHNSIMRMEVIDQNLEESENLIKSRITRIQNQYEESISPYPGEISDSISCPPDFKPQINTYEENGINISSFLVKLNERMVTGQCQESLIKYHAYNHYFHCADQNKTFLVEIIYEKNIGEIKPLVFSCN